MRSKSLKVVLLDGTPYGVKTAELSNWNGKAIIAPRAALKKLKELPEAEMPAVYFLLGDENHVYVGETDALGQRLAHHAITKPNWSDLIAFTSPKLTKTEVKYLEHVFTKRLASDGLVALENGTSPKSPTISIEDQDVMEEFVDRASDVLLSLGYSLLGASHEVEAAAKQSGVSVTCVGPDANAQGVYGESGLLVLKGSLARKQHAPAFEGHNYFKQRTQMIESGILSSSDDRHYSFTQDHLFSSPSAAAAIVRASSMNGLNEWKTQDGKSIKELEQNNDVK